MNSKVKSFKQTVFLLELCDVKSYNKYSESSLLALTQAHNCFPTYLLPCR